MEKRKALNNVLGTDLHKMTLIIGSRCKDGVVIISDKKVVEGTDITSQDKINLLPLSIAVAGAGVGEIIDKFNERIPTVLNERKKISYNEIKEIDEEITLENSPYYVRPYEFLQDCEGILFRLKEDYIRDEHPELHSFVMIGLVLNGIAELHVLDTINCLDSKRRTYKTIGCGSPYADFLLKKLWNKDLNMNEMAKIGKFIINYIEESKIDNNVGMGVQCVFLPDVPEEYKSGEKEMSIDFIPKEETIDYDDREIIKEFNDFLLKIDEKIKE